MRLKQHAVMLIHHGSIGKDGSAAFLQAIGLMDVAEKMYRGRTAFTRERSSLEP